MNKSLDILSDALRLYGPDRMFSSYNGGKDADVIMHLLRAVFAKYSEEFGVHAVPEMVYFVHSDEFDEVTEHIENSKRLFDLKVTTYDTSVVQGLKQHIKLRGKDSHCAFVLGTRRGDPNCGNQEIFAPSSSWMPLPFMRINPILNW
jgi:FAD synthetase